MDANELRIIAEQHLKDSNSGNTPLIDDLDVQRILHELQVHQIELEMQNEQLQQAHSEAETNLERYTGLYDFAPVAYFTLDRGSNILRVNLTGASLLKTPRSSLVNKRLLQYVPLETRVAFSNFLARVFDNHSRQATQMLLQTDNGERLRVQMDAMISPNENECLITITNINESKMLEDILWESEEKYKIIADHTVDWESWFAPDGKYIWVNPAVEQITGYSPEEILAMPDFVPVLIAREDRKVFGTNFKAALSGIPGNNFEFRFIHKNGSKLWLGVSWRPIYSSNGNYLGVRATGRDITKRKHAEEALRDSESRLSEAQRVAHIGSWELDIRTHALEWSDETFRLFGFQKGDFGATMEAFLECVHPDDREMMSVATQAAWYENQPFDIEHRIILPGGAQRTVREIAEITFDDDGQPVRMVGTIQDITNSKQMENALRHSEERMKDIIFSIADWVWETDENGVYTYSSQQGLELFGRSSEEIIGKTPFDFMEPDEIERVSAIFSQIAANKAHIKDMENWCTTKDGKRICLLTNGVPILDQQGNLKGYRGVDKDITERKLVENEKRQFYRDTIHSVTQGKLNLVSFEEVEEYLSPAGLIFIVESIIDSANARRKAMDFGTSNGLSEDASLSLEQAAGEAITNAIKHAEGCLVYAGVNSKSVWIAISDTGQGISTELISDATLRIGFSSKVSMGMGYTIMLDSTDTMLLCTGLKGTTIVLLVNRTSSQSALPTDNFPDTWDVIP